MDRGTSLRVGSTTPTVWSTTRSSASCPGLALVRGPEDRDATAALPPEFLWPRSRSKPSISVPSGRTDDLVADRELVRALRSKIGRAGSQLWPPFVVRAKGRPRKRTEFVVRPALSLARRSAAVPDCVDEVRVDRVGGDRLLVDEQRRSRVVLGSSVAGSLQLAAVGRPAGEDRRCRGVSLRTTSAIAWASRSGPNVTHGSRGALESPPFAACRPRSVLKSATRATRSAAVDDVDGERPWRRRPTSGPAARRRRCCSGLVGLTATHGSTSAFWYSTLEAKASPAPPHPGANGLGPLAVVMPLRAKGLRLPCQPRRSSGRRRRRARQGLVAYRSYLLGAFGARAP